MPYCMDWHAGPASQLEVFGPRDPNVSPYQLKYTPAFRATIRPPLETCNLGPSELERIGEILENLTAQVQGRSATSPVGARPAGASAVLARMEQLGSMLLRLTVPPYVETDLRVGGQFIEIGVDESLLAYPWELMYVGDDFLCMKHAVGRFVNGATTLPTGMMTTIGPQTSFSELSVLVVSVPAPLPRKSRTFDRLPSVEAETLAIMTTLEGIPGIKVKLLAGNGATFDGLFDALKEGHQIIHFCGHAFFDEQRPRSSGLVLQDADMPTGAIVGFVANRRPILCFVNGCESARSGTGGNGSWQDSYNIYSLARAFMDTGAYLLGSRWKVDDQAAATFAEAFYRFLLKDGVPIGNAVQQARKVCLQNPTDAFSWASYILYGDPRVCFRRLPEPGVTCESVAIS